MLFVSLNRFATFTKGFVMQWVKSMFLVAGLALVAGPALAAEKAQQVGPSPLANTLGPKVEILSYDHDDVSPWAEFFVFDRPSHPKIVKLRKDYKLDELVKDAKTDLDRAVALKKWTFNSLCFGRPAPKVFKDWSALSLLEGAKRKETVWCGQAAMVVQQACIALGMNCRFVETGVKHNPCNHFLTEVYLREFGKWAVIDATAHETFDVYYTVDGVPQSALEMHNHVVNGTLDKVTEVRPSGTTQGSDKVPTNLFYYLRWLTKNDIVTNTPRYNHMEDVFDKRWGTVEWVDDKTVPWEKQNISTWYMRNERPAAWTISDPAVVSWAPSDRAMIKVCPNENNLLFFQLWNADIDFDHYQVKVDGHDWEDLPEGNITEAYGERLGWGDVQKDRRYGWGKDRCSLFASPGEHEVRVRIVRGSGEIGPESFVKLRVPEQAKS
jgi:hypothetical protein